MFCTVAPRRCPVRGSEHGTSLRIRTYLPSSPDPRGRCRRARRRPQGDCAKPVFKLVRQSKALHGRNGSLQRRLLLGPQAPRSRTRGAPYSTPVCRPYRKGGARVKNDARDAEASAKPPAGPRCASCPSSHRPNRACSCFTVCVPAGLLVQQRPRFASAQPARPLRSCPLFPQPLSDRLLARCLYSLTPAIR